MLMNFSGPATSAQRRRGEHKSSSSSYYIGPVAPLAVAPLPPNAKKNDGQKLLTTASGRKVPIQPSVSVKEKRLAAIRGFKGSISS